ncbi:hypothetical protein GCM10009111_19870 [Colwellia asteriadis]|uniref:Hydrazine synthase alpha subunit middle domain-containing protein n=1 Tax=Colwellia asteriadis TaxID=517723 RepID=A0ABN1L7D0_9GAMM
MHSQLSCNAKKTKTLTYKSFLFIYPLLTPSLYSLFFLALCVTSFSSLATSFKTQINAANNEEFYQPDYPLIFVSAPIKVFDNTYGGVTGTYKLGTDVLSANNPSGGNELWILLPNGQSKKLFPLEIHLQQQLIDTPTGMLNQGSVVEPNLSEDGKTVYFSYFHNADDKTYQSGLPKLGADIYSINLGDLLADYSFAPELLPAKRLTYANTNDNNEFDIYKDAMNLPLKQTGSHNWGNVYMHAEEMRTDTGLKLIYVSNKKRISNANLAMGYANHNFNLFSADITDNGDLKNHQQFQYYTTTSALSPNKLRNGIAFSYQATTEDARHWQIQGLTSSGKWYPIFGYGNSPEAAHLSTFCVKGKGANPGDYLITTSYYNLNNNGFGALHSVKLSMAGLNAYDRPDAGVEVPRQLGAKLLTKGVDIHDLPSDSHNGILLGKFTTPRCGKADELFFSHTKTSANNRGLDSEKSKGVYESYIGFRKDLEAFDPTESININANTGIIKVIEDESGTTNLLWPLPVITWEERSGDKEQTYSAPAVASATTITPGSPFAQVGTSALWNTDRKPFDCWLGGDGKTPFSPNKANKDYNSERQELIKQSAPLTRVQNQNDFCEYLLPENVLGVAINLTSNKLKNSYASYRSAGSQTKETSRLLGVYSVVNQVDQSFKAIIPANVPFDFHLLDRETGLKLTDTRSWHSLKPEEDRTDCGGCHQHEKNKAIPFEETFSAQNEPLNMVEQTSYIDYDAQCNPEVKISSLASIAPLEWVADIWPGFDRNCSDCHNSTISEDTLALKALNYNNEQDAYNMLIARKFINQALGAIGSPAWWAARGKRTDGRDNDLEKYQTDYDNEQWGFRHSNIHGSQKPLCNGNSPDEAKWVYKFGHWIDNFQHRDVNSGVFNTKLDRYHPTVSSSIGGNCAGGDLTVGWWDDSGKIEQLTVNINGNLALLLNNQANNSTEVAIGNLQDNDSIYIEAKDFTGNTQRYEKSFKHLVSECNARVAGENVFSTAKPYSNEHDYTEEQTALANVLANEKLGAADPTTESFNQATDTTSALSADIDIPIDEGVIFSTIELPIQADATVSQYNSSEKKMNFGGSQELNIGTGKARRILIKADLSLAPVERELLKASLKVFVLQASYTSSPMLLAFEVNKPWVEGNRIWGGIPNGATWLEHNYLDHNYSTENDWLIPGGELDLTSNYGYGENGLIKRAPIIEGEWVSLDITPIVQAWKSTPESNHGLLLRGIMRAGNYISFASKEHSDPTLAPKIEYHYAGEPIAN